jgi:hypothetical protein
MIAKNCEFFYFIIITLIFTLFFRYFHIYSLTKLKSSKVNLSLHRHHLIFKKKIMLWKLARLKFFAKYSPKKNQTWLANWTDKFKVFPFTKHIFSRDEDEDIYFTFCCLIVLIRCLLRRVLCSVFLSWSRCKIREML